MKRMINLSLIIFVANAHGTSAIVAMQRNLPYSKGANSKGACTSFTTYDQCTSGTEGEKPKKVRFDTDSFEIKVDNCCTRSITPYVGDFVGTVTPVHGHSVRGFNGQSTKITNMGTVRWTINDDDGVARDLVITNTYYVPGAPARLLSPQHWAQQAKDCAPLPKGTWCATYDTEIVLQWSQRKYTKTISLDPTAQNVGTMWSTPGYNRYARYTPDTDHQIAYQIDNVITDDEDDGMGYETDPEETEDMHELADIPSAHSK
jgi:hypothetical protein